ncbi:hypothetical protein Pelo_10752 [Pelomyxa schiedti]|nr:hypothetical protein Pelo_10752 [Pelomyxa schiedti]
MTTESLLQEIEELRAELKKKESECKQVIKPLSAPERYTWVINTENNNLCLMLNHNVQLGPDVQTHSIALVQNRLREIPVYSRVKEVPGNNDYPWEISKMVVTVHLERVPPPDPKRMAEAAPAIEALVKSSDKPQLMDALKHLEELGKEGPNGLHKTLLPLLETCSNPHLDPDVRHAAQDVLRNLVDDFMPIDEFLKIMDGPDKEEALAAKKVLEGQLECLDKQGSPESRLIRLLDNLKRDLPENAPLPETKNATAEAIKALEKDLTKESETIEFPKIPDHVWKPRSPRKLPSPRPASPKISPAELAQELAAKAVDDAHDAVGSSEAAVEDCKLADKLTTDPEKKNNLNKKKKQALEAQKTADLALKQAEEVEDDLQEVLGSDVIDPSVMDDKLEACRQAAKEAGKAADMGNQAESQCADALAEGVADADEEDLKPKALAAARIARHDAKKAGKHSKEAEKYCDKAREILPKIPDSDLSPEQKEEIAKKADREEQHADSALKEAKKANQVAKQVPIDCETRELIKPAYLAAIPAQQKAKKAKDKAEHAHKKAKKLVRDLMDHVPPETVPLPDLAEDAKKMAEDAKERADVVDKKAEKAAMIAEKAPVEQKPQAEEVKEKAHRADVAAKEAEKAALQALDKVKELEKAVEHLQEHPEDTPQVLEMAKAAREFAKEADKLAEIAEKLAQDLDMAMHSAVAPPELGDTDLGVEPDVPLGFNLPPYAEDNLEDIILDLPKEKNPFLEPLLEAMKKEQEKEGDLAKAAESLDDKADKLLDHKRKEDEEKKNAAFLDDESHLHPSPESILRAQKGDEDAKKAEDETLHAKLDAGEHKAKALEAKKDADVARAAVEDLKVQADEWDKAHEPNMEDRKPTDELGPIVQEEAKKADINLQDALDKLDKANAFEPYVPKQVSEVAAVDELVKDLERKLADAVKDAEDAQKQVEEAEEAKEKAHDQADKLEEEAKIHPTPENIQAAEQAATEADDADEEALLAKIKAGEARGTADDILNALELERAKQCDLRIKHKNDLYPDAEEPSPDDIKEYNDVKAETEGKEDHADKDHGKSMEELKKAHDYEPHIPTKPEVAKEFVDKALPIAVEADSVAQDAVNTAKNVAAVNPDVPPVGYDPAFNKALIAKGRAHDAIRTAKETDDKALEALGHPLSPEDEDKLLDDAKQALKKSKKALEDAKEALDDCKKLEAVPSAADPSDVVPKVNKACKQTHDLAHNAHEKKPETEGIAEQAQEIVKPLQDIPPHIKDDILHEAEEAKKDADKADDQAKHADKLADEAEEAVKEADPDKLVPALEKALDALALAKKADKASKKAQKKAKEAKHKAQDCADPSEKAECAEPQKLVDDVKKLADDLKNKVKDGEPDIEKARSFVLPLEITPEVGKDLLDHADETDKLAHNADGLADDLKHRADEVQPILDDCKAHPDDLELKKKAEDLAKELYNKAKDADKVGDKSDGAAEDLDTDLDNLLPIFADDLSELGTKAEIEAPLQEAHEEPHDHSRADSFPCPFCTNPKWNWPEIFREGFGLTEEQMEKMSEEERCDKKLEALQKAIDKLTEISRVIQNQKLNLESTPLHL